MKKFQVNPGYYLDDSDIEYRRCYYLTGNKSGNFWINLSLPEPEWWKLTWTCIPKNIDTMKFSNQNPIKYEIEP